MLPEDLPPFLLRFLSNNFSSELCQKGWWVSLFSLSFTIKTFHFQIELDHVGCGSTNTQLYCKTATSLLSNRSMQFRRHRRCGERRCLSQLEYLSAKFMCIVSDDYVSL